eukprot:5248143-Pleurochrysis_carterae.AAC.2
MGYVTDDGLNDREQNLRRGRAKRHEGEVGDRRVPNGHDVLAALLCFEHVRGRGDLLDRCHEDVSDDGNAKKAPRHRQKVQDGLPRAVSLPGSAWGEKLDSWTLAF